MPKDKHPEYHGKAGKKPLSEADAKGQFAKSQADSKNDGVISANPRVLSGKKDGDATFPLKQGRWQRKG